MRYGVGLIGPLLVFAMVLPSQSQSASEDIEQIGKLIGIDLRWLAPTYADRNLNGLTTLADRAVVALRKNPRLRLPEKFNR